MYEPQSRISGIRRALYRLVRSLAAVYSLPVIRIAALDPIGWYRPAVKKGLEIMGKERVDIIFSSYGPALSHFVAARLHRQTGVPWVAEFRDLWSFNHYVRKVQPFHFFDKQLEKRILRGSSLVVTASEPAARQQETLHGKKVLVIHNGFDDEDYRKKAPLTAGFTITYTGVIYPGKQDPSPLFRAIAELKQEDRIRPGDVEVRFFGGSSLSMLKPVVEACRVDEFVKIRGLVAFKESIKNQQESTALLLLGWTDPLEKGAYSAKVFEYLGAQRPILAIGLKGDVVDDLLAETGTGVVLNDVGEIKALLLQWMREFREYRTVVSHFEPKDSAIARYTRRQQTAKLAQAFQDARALRGVP